MNELEQHNEIERLRAALRERMRKVPPGLSGASVQAVRDYKKRHQEAAKLLTKKSPSVGELTSAINSVS